MVRIKGNTKGSELSNQHAIVSFENTGDIGIRGSKDQPITVSLKATGTDAALAQWEVTQNVVPGQKVELSGNLSITKTLPDQTGLYLSVTEDASYTENPFSASTNTLFTVETNPELSISDNHITLGNVDEDGNVVINVDFMANNRGTEKAKNVKAVFSYASTAEKRCFVICKYLL